MAWNDILFDLDGTITDSREGILNCVRYVLETAKLPILPESDLLAFIGPPLVEGFQNIVGMTYEDAVWATQKYRERYSVQGMYECRIYDGIDKVLQTLHEDGKRVVLATSKPEEYARKILAHFNLLEYFDEVVGSTLDGKREGKSAVIQEVFRRLHTTSEEKKKMIMVGDRKHDIIGAKECGLKSCGVYYGFASEHELEECGADYIVQSVEELLPLLYRD